MRACTGRTSGRRAGGSPVPELSILVPARNEEWLPNTVADVLEHTSERTEIIVVLDGAWPATPLPQHERLQVIYLPQSIGQRAATNLAARISTADYLCKLDAHCAVAPGFDTVLLDAARELGPDVTQIPRQWNLHVYDYVCTACGRRDDQAPARTECAACGSTDLRKDLVWQTRTSTSNWTLDSDLRFCYASDKQQSGDICDVMTSLGACFFMSRARFWALGGLDEAHGSWGQFGCEIALKSWLSGGRHVVNKRTWFAHFFRVGGIGFPYEIHASDQERARQYSRALWRANGWPGQVRPLRWLVETFAPAGWTAEQIDALPVRLPTNQARGIVYYTDGGLGEWLARPVRDRLESTGLPIVSVILNGSDGWRSRVHEICMDGERGPLMMFRQILAGLEALDTDYAFLCEHDCLYHTSHFEFVPPRDDTYYYNLNVYKVDATTGRAVTYVTKQTSGLCANRRLLLEHYRKRVARVEADGFSRRMGFEPGSHRRAERVDDVPSDVWRSEFPNLDIRHERNLTSTRWSPDQFRDQRHCQGWQEVEEIPGWGVVKGRMDAILGRAYAVQ